MLNIFFTKEVFGLFFFITFWSIFSSLATYFVFQKYVKSLKVNLVIAGLTPLTQVIFLFAFKMIGQIQLGLIILTLIYMYVLWKNKSKISIKKIKNLEYISIFIPAFIIICLSYLHDALTHISIGFPDTYNSWIWIDRILSGSPAEYQPGYSLVLAPYYYIFSLENFLNYVGTLAGLTFLMQSLVIMYAFNKKLSLFFLAILPLPIFLELNKTIIALTSNSLSILLFVGFLAGVIIFLEKNREKICKFESNIVIFVALVSSFIVAPPLGYYLFSSLVLLGLALMLIFKKIYFLKPLLFSLLGMTLYLTNAIFSPFVYAIYQEGEFPASISNSNVRNVSIAILESSPNFYENQNPDSESLTRPITYLKIILEDIIFQQDDIRKISSVFDLAGYVVLIIFFCSLIYFFIQRNIALAVISFYGLFFGLITMLGVLDVTFFKGRSGWYFLLTTAIGISIIFTKIFQKRLQVLLAFSSLFLINFAVFTFSPIEHYRYLDEKIYFEIKRIIKNENYSDLILINNDIPYVEIVDSKINSMNIEDILTLDPKKYNILIILDFDSKILDPVLSRQYSFREVQGDNIEEKLRSQVTSKIIKNQKNEKLLISAGYSVIYEADTFKIYKFLR